MMPMYLKYDFGFGVPAPKALTVLMKEHQRRSDIFGDQKEPSANSGKQPSQEGTTTQTEAQEESCKCVKISSQEITDKEELIANCSSPPVFRGPIFRKKEVPRPYEDLMPIINNVGWA